jgi:hypothetical protein
MQYNDVILELFERVSFDNTRLLHIACKLV